MADVGFARRGVIRGTLVNFGATALGIAIAFTTTPFFVDRLGAEAYGLYVLALVFTMGGYFGYLDLGIPAAVIKFGGTEAADGRWGAFSRVAATATALLSVVGVVAAAALVVLAFVAHRIFDVPPEFQDDFRLALLVGAAVLLVQFPALAVGAAVQAVQRYDLVVLQRALAATAGVLLAVALVAATGDLRGYIIPVVALPVAGSLGLYWIARRMIPGFSIRPSRASRADIRALYRFGLTVFVAQVGVAVAANLDQILIATTLTAKDLGIYGIAAALYYPVFGLTAITNSTIFPASVHLAAGGDMARVRNLLVRGTRIAAAIILCGSAVVAVWAEPFARVWIAESFGESGELVTIWLSHMVLTAFVGIGWSMFGALGRVSDAARIAILAAAVNLLASLALIGPFGLSGVVAGTVAAYVVTAPLIARVFLDATGLSVRAFVGRAVLPALPAPVLTAAAALALRLVFQPSTMVSVVAAGAASGLVAAVAVYAALGGVERAALVDAVRRR